MCAFFYPRWYCRWLEPLQKLIDEVINKRFQEYFKHMGCIGEVTLQGHEVCQSEASLELVAQTCCRGFYLCLIWKSLFGRLVCIHVFLTRTSANMQSRSESSFVTVRSYTYWTPNDRAEGRGVSPPCSTSWHSRASPPVPLGWWMRSTRWAGDTTFN